jgi:hypothetical protein
LPLELDRVGLAVALDRATVVGAERIGDRRPDVVVVGAGEHPALALEPRDQLGRQGAKHGRRVSYRGGPAPGGRIQAREQHQAGELEPVAQFMVHAHGLVRRPLGRGVQAVGVGLAGGEGLPFGHQAGGQPPEDRAGLRGITQPEAADQDPAMLGGDGEQRVPVVGRPSASVVAGVLGSQHRELAGLQVHV